MAININPNIQANQNVASVFNAKNRVKDLAAEKKLLDAPLVVPQSQEVVKADEATLLQLDADRHQHQHQQQQQQQQQADSNEAGASRDAPDRHTKQALTAYRDVGLAEKRSEIQALVGVDIYV